MSIQAWVLLACHIPLLGWMVWDRFRTVNRWADWFEEYILPKWARWSTQGDWISWFQHFAWSLLGSLYVGVLGSLCPEGFMFGAMLGGWVAVGLYAVRESICAWGKRGDPNPWRNPKPNRVGWAVDGLLDVILPLTNALLWTVL
jgi:hypothetical protein